MGREKVRTPDFTATATATATAASARVLDNSPTGQAASGDLRRSLCDIVRRAYGWTNHPATRMWRGFVPALVCYGLSRCDKWETRGRATPPGRRCSSSPALLCR